MSTAICSTLLAPSRLWKRDEVLARPCPVPKHEGVYAWFFREIPAELPTRDCVQAHGATLLYVGISPKKPPTNGTAPSRQRLFHRVRYHYRGNAYGSTLRLTLGCLLADELGIQLRRVGSGTRLTFADGEARLSEWMERHALVAWLPTESPWELEHELISKLSLPLNLSGNERHPFYPTLSAARSQQRARALQLPVYRP